MNLPPRKPCIKSREAMCKAAKEIGSKEFSMKKEVNDAKKAFSSITGHRHIELLSSCDAAIMLVLKSLNGKVMIPDQGGWKGFKTLPRLFGLEIREIATKFGIIDPKYLEDKIQEEIPNALFLTSFAGYLAEQPVKKIHTVCKKLGVLLIEDASGAIGDEILCKSKNADIIIGSMGSPKIVNLYSGGFISTDNVDILETGREIVRACKINPITCAGIKEELKVAPHVIQILNYYTAIIKKELNTVIHRKERGVCVGIKMDNIPKDIVKKAYINGLKTNLGSPILTLCPEYNRFMKPGLTIELKKLNVLDIQEKEILKISKTLKHFAKI
tara:strand:+ start:9677 stop:10660 length:984 start_codon:yes stop_codon:yes gene_type:complete